MHHTAATLLVLSFGGHALLAQDVRPGARVRITSQHYSLTERVGSVLSETSDSMVVRFTGVKTVQYRQVSVDDTITIARNALDRLEVSEPGERQTKRGAIIGAAVGAAVGLVIGISGHKECDQQCLDMGEGATGLTYAVMGAGIGLVTGAVVGTMIRTNTWVTVTPQGVGLSIAF